MEKEVIVPHRSRGRTLEVMRSLGDANDDDTIAIFALAYATMVGIDPMQSLLNGLTGVAMEHSSPEIRSLANDALHYIEKDGEKDMSP